MYIFVLSRRVNYLHLHMSKMLSLTFTDEKIIKSEISPKVTQTTKFRGRNSTDASSTLHQAQWYEIINVITLFPALKYSRTRKEKNYESEGFTHTKQYRWYTLCTNCADQVPQERTDQYSAISKVVKHRFQMQICVVKELQSFHYCYLPLI